MRKKKRNLEAAFAAYLPTPYRAGSALAIGRIFAVELSGARTLRVAVAAEVFRVGGAFNCGQAGGQQGRQPEGGRR